MLSLRSAKAASQPPPLKRLLEQRTLDDESAHFLVVEPGDLPSALQAELGFTPLENLVDGARFGDPDFEPSWEWIERHDGGWFELVFLLTDDGFATVVFVPDDDGIDPTLLTLCRQYAPA